MRATYVLIFLLAVQATWVSTTAGGRTLFAALRSMIDTLESEHRLLIGIEEYAFERFEKLETIKGVYDRWELLHYETQLRLRRNKTDAVARFKLIQRITRYWGKFKTDFLDKSQEQQELEDLYNQTLIPQVSDVRGFARLLLVNAKTYHKNPSDLLTARSAFVTINEILELSFRIDHHSLGYDDDDSLLTASDIALYGLTEFCGTSQGKMKLSRSGFEILSALTDRLYESGFWNLGHAVCKRILEIFPDDDEFYFKAGMFRDRLGRSNSKDKSKGLSIHPEKLDTDRDRFSWLCRHRNLSAPPSPELKCYYFHKNSHLRYIAAHKVEEVSKRPDIRLYHDVLYDREIQQMQHFATPLLSVAKVYNPKQADVDISEDRISNNAWFMDPDRSSHQPVDVAYLYRKLNQRLEDCTGLNKEGTEGIQVNNYGIGGHYLWHYDSLFYNAELDYYPDDRIATWMFYLNDVTEGGNTVFPKLNISIPPKRGSAVFWYNLHPSGELDRRTLHGGCPILHGTKWVANLWVGEFPQAFIRKCLPGGDKETSRV